jgi:hypothetical protein
MSFKKQRVGISMWASLAASKIVAPFGASMGIPFIFILTVSINNLHSVMLVTFRRFLAVQNLKEVQNEIPMDFILEFFPCEDGFFFTLVLITG